MTGDPRQLSEDDSTVLGPQRRLDTEQRLCRHGKSEANSVRSAIVEALRQGHALPVGPLFGEFLETGVHKARFERGGADIVTRHMNVKLQRRIADRTGCVDLELNGPWGRCVDRPGLRSCACRFDFSRQSIPSQRTAFAQRIDDAVLWCEQASKVRMLAELDTEHLVELAFGPGRRRPQPCRCRQQRCRCRDFRVDPQARRRGAQQV